MTLKYADKNAIAKLLNGRLKIGDQPIATLPMSGQIVDPELIEIAGDEEESFIDLVLGQIYELPLQLSSPIVRSHLRNVADNLIIGRIMEVHFQGSQIANLGQDATGLGPTYRKRGLDLLQTLVIGHNVFIPGQAPTNSSVPGAVPQPVVLTGEKLLTKQPDTITRSYTFIGKRDTTADSMGINFCGNRPGHCSRASGSETPLRHGPRFC